MTTGHPSKAAWMEFACTGTAVTGDSLSQTLCHRLSVTMSPGLSSARIASRMFPSLCFTHSTVGNTVVLCAVARSLLPPSQGMAVQRSSPWPTPRSCGGTSCVTLCWRWCRGPWWWPATPLAASSQPPWLLITPALSRVSRLVGVSHLLAKHGMAITVLQVMHSL